MYARTRLRAGVVRGANCNTYASKGPKEGVDGATQNVLDAGPTPMTVCYPPRTRVTIRHRHSFRQEEEDEDDDGYGLQERENYE
jgi:hypothetical protein